MRAQKILAARGRCDRRCGVSRSHEIASKKLLRVLVSLKIQAIATTITTLSFEGGSRAPHMLEGREGLRILRAATLDTE